jgi:hypothetical protein
MSRNFVILTALVFGAVLTQSLPVVAGPVSDADFRGKKICWNTGITSSYNKDGSFDSNRSGHGTWQLVGDQLSVNASRSRDKHSHKRRESISLDPKGLQKWQGYRSLGQLLQLILPKYA